LLNDPAHLYRISTDPIRRQLNEAFFQRLFLDENGVADGWLTDVAHELHQEKDAFELASASAGRQVTRTDLRTTKRGSDDRVTEPSRFSEAVQLADHWVSGSSKTAMVGLTGFEPAASSSRTTRATKLRHSP
jgi:site-specific DNA recombinase